jgi:hemerythrin-like metal-binding protein
MPRIDPKFYTTGVFEIDLEHFGLFMQTSCILGLVHSGQCNQAREAIQELQALSAEHFTHEEALMNQYDFPAKGPHAARHAEILVVLATLLESGEDLCCKEIVDAVEGHVLEHIMTFDFPMSQHIKATRLG